ncbi:MAG TPA: FAD-binding oxidoreductase [Thermoleophilaceae bacterium]|nr:FAD-binding oxidoreductase [Thermoleophilaceae bacterium]
MSFEDSLWHSTAGDSFTARPPLPGDIDVDVAIVGAGYTGLWTAYYLNSIDPSIRIAIVEREIAGFGASGRNGGWCSALFPPASTGIARRHGADAAVAMRRAMHEAVVEVGRVAEAEGLDIHYARGGTISLARNQAQLARARELVDEERDVTGDVEGLELLSKEDAEGLLRATNVLGGTYTPHCAAIHPLRLVRGLASRLEARGVSIFEGTTASEIQPGAVVTDHGRVRAEIVVRATEGYTPSLRGQRRRVIPLYSLMIATEPLPEEVWDRIGLRRRETFADLRHMRIYGQRTADDRFAFGGRGAPYHFASRTRPSFDRNRRVHSALREVLVDLFPVVADHRVTHEWGGALAIPRDWHASVGLDRASGLAWAGGYVGDGVATTNLAGRTLAQLIGSQENGLAGLPWVGHSSRSWEPEPLRWLGVNGGRLLMSSADRSEDRTGRPAQRAKAFARFIGY